MVNKQLFNRSGSVLRLLYLVMFVLTGFLAVSILLGIFFIITGIRPDPLMASAGLLKFIQGVQAVCLFLLPALFFIRLTDNSFQRRSLLRASFGVKQAVLVVLVMLAVTPAINFTGHYNQLVPLPEGLAAMEQSANQLAEKMLSDKGWFAVISSLFVIAFIAAVGEELLFRACLLPLFSRLTRNIHWGIWITAIIFSAIHFQFSGFVPRMLLGAILGYIFVWTGSIWASVLAHFVNNALAVITQHLFVGTPTYDYLNNIGTGSTSWISLISCVLTVAILYLLRQTRVAATPDFMENASPDNLLP